MLVDLERLVSAHVCFVHVSTGSADFSYHVQIKLINSFGQSVSQHLCMHDQLNIGRFYTKDALSDWTNLGKCFVVRLRYASLV